MSAPRTTGGDFVSVGELLPAILEALMERAEAEAAEAQPAGTAS